MLLECTLSLVACLGMGFCASLVSHTEHPGCGGTEIVPQSPACHQGRGGRGQSPLMKDDMSWLSPRLDHT